MSFLYPELLLLALPAAWLLWRTSPAPSLRLLLRALLLGSLLLALAGPYAGGRSTGRDLVLVVDRSRSMPGGAAATVTEMAELLEQQAQAGDRLAVLSFGAEVALEREPGPAFAFDGFRGTPDPDGSHLADALDQALALIPENRPGSILLLSDGEFHGASPEDAARRAALRGVRLDVRGAGHPVGVDVAVDALELPESVGLGEPFQFAGWVRSDRAVEVGWRLLRGEEVIARGRRELRRGLNHLRFRDLGRAPGLARYRLLLEADGDRVPENDRGLGVTRVEGRRPLLLVNDDGGDGRLAVALREAGMQVETRRPEELPQGDPAFLESYSAVVLENVAVGRLGRLAEAVARQVEDLGGGLMVTGGQASFGVGGYYQSALDPVIPVTMEVRIEHRKMALALAVVLDRSGSMSASAGQGLTKMDLANAGAMEAARLLGPIDEVSVIAVDSEAHTVVGLRPVDDPAAILDQISGIQSMGGGIYTYTGLLAAAHQLERARATNRHIILFADAADAEEPGEFRQLLKQLTEERSTTVSVVALGTPSDSDASFLREVAQRGGGEVYFTTSPQELPRLFAQDTLLAARSSFVDQPTGTVATPGMMAIGAAGAGPWAPLPGYNLTYGRPGAATGVRTTDEYAAPVAATMQAGLGRSAAYTGQVDGEFGVADADWPEVAQTLVTLARWLVGQEPPGEYFPSVRREGREAVLSVEVDRERAPGAAAETLIARMVRPDGSSLPVPLAPVAGDRFEARVPLGGEGVYRFAAQTADGEPIPLAPLAVPYSPEFEPRLDPGEGVKVLGQLARIGRGRLNPPLHEALQGERSGRATRPMALWFALAALFLLLAEILWRRWYETSAPRRRPAPPLEDATPETAAARSPRPAAGPSPPATTRAKPPAPTEGSAAAPVEASAEEPKQAPAPSLNQTLSALKRKRRS